MEKVVFFLISALCLVAIVAFAKRRLNNQPSPRSLTDAADGILNAALFDGGSDCSSHSHGSHDHGSHHTDTGSHHSGFDGGHFDAGGHH